MDKNNMWPKALSLVFTISAWIIGLFFLVVTLVIFFGGGGPDTPKFMGIITLFIGIYNFLILFAIGKILSTLLRVSNALALLNQQLAKDQPPSGT